MTYQIQFINGKTNKVFRLPITYIDRTEACVCGQNYCRDRQQEDGTVLFFRLVEADTDVVEDEEDEEPEHSESVFGGALVTELIDLLKSKSSEAAEEPHCLFKHWDD